MDMTIIMPGLISIDEILSLMLKLKVGYFFVSNLTFNPFLHSESIARNPIRVRAKITAFEMNIYVFSLT